MWWKLKLFFLIIGVAAFAARADMLAQLSSQYLPASGSMAGYGKTVRVTSDASPVGEDNRTDLVAFLPEPYGAWKRRDWTPQLAGLLDLREIPPFKAEQAAVREEIAVSQRGSSSAQRNTLLYQRDRELVEITIRRPPDGMIGIVEDLVSAQGGSLLFTDMGGVTFIEDKQGFADHPYGTRMFRAAIGETVQLRITARARESSIKALLERIDYAGILEHVGEEAGDVSASLRMPLPQINAPPAEDLSSSEMDGLMDDLQEMVRTDVEATPGFIRSLLGLNDKGDTSEEKTTETGVKIHRGGLPGCETRETGCARVRVTQ